MAEIYNHDVRYLARKIKVFITELAKSQSSGVSGMLAFDQARLLSYLSSLRSFRNWATTQPQLDLPETHPLKLTIDPPVLDDEYENEEIEALITLFNALFVELTNSQSARLSSGFTPFDVNRFDAMITKIEEFLLKYIAVSTPLDLPESAPKAPMITGGSTGTSGVKTK